MAQHRVLCTKTTASALLTRPAPSVEQLSPPVADHAASSARSNGRKALTTPVRGKLTLYQRHDGEKPLRTKRRAFDPLIFEIHKSISRLSSNDFDRSNTIHCPSGEIVNAPVNSFSR